MILNYAVDRLYAGGWSFSDATDGVELLPDGRPFPSVMTVNNEFSRAGLELSIKHNLIFNCYRAT